MPSTGKRSVACWSHPGSYLSELGLKTVGGDRLLIAAGEGDKGFASVSLNGNTLSVSSERALENGGSVSYFSSHEARFASGPFIITIENIDGFVNLRTVKVAPTSKSLQSHGLLGQTWNTKKYSGKVKDIEGEVDDYVVISDDLFGDDFVFNKFPVSQE